MQKAPCSLHNGMTVSAGRHFQLKTMKEKRPFRQWHSPRPFYFFLFYFWGDPSHFLSLGGIFSLFKTTLLNENKTIDISVTVCSFYFFFHWKTPPVVESPPGLGSWWEMLAENKQHICQYKVFAKCVFMYIFWGGRCRRDDPHYYILLCHGRDLRNEWMQRGIDLITSSDMIGYQVKSNVVSDLRTHLRFSSQAETV